MKTISFFLATAIFGLLTFAGSAQNDQNLTLVTNIKMDNVDRLAIQSEGDVSFSYWDHDYAQVELSISANDLKRSQLKSLLALGLFSLKTERYGQMTVLRMPRLEQGVTIGGKELQPLLGFHVRLPRTAELEQDKNMLEIIAANK